MQTKNEERFIGRYFERKGVYVQFDVNPIFDTTHEQMMDFEHFYQYVDETIKYISLNLITENMDVTTDTRNMFHALYVVRDMFAKMDKRPTPPNIKPLK